MKAFIRPKSNRRSSRDAAEEFARGADGFCFRLHGADAPAGPDEPQEPLGGTRRRGALGIVSRLAAAEMALYQQICKRTQAAFGQPLNPHRFRDAAATTMAIANPEHVRLASTLLGHTNQTATERHYQQAQSLSAHRHYAGALRAVLDSTRQSRG